MKKEFVPYELQVRLNNLGLKLNKEEILGIWCIDDDPKAEIYFKKGDKLETIDDIPAMIYQQAFDFFREEYFLHSLIDISISNKWFFEIYNLNSKRNSELNTDDIYFNTYEKARLECLKKLIEIIENENTTTN